MTYENKWCDLNLLRSRNFNLWLDFIIKPMVLDYKGKRLLAFSDTHGMHRKLSIPKGTDILICAGDVVSDFQENGLSDFFDWFSSCPAQLRLFVLGNHEIIFDLYPFKKK